MSASELLEKLTEFYAQRDLLGIDRRRAEQSAIPAEVQARLDEIAAEFGDKAAAVNDNIAALEAQVKEAVLAEGETIKGGALQAVWVKGRVSWDSKALDGYCKAHPELAEYRKQGEPSVAIRKVGG